MTERKKILFCIQHFQHGGIQKSLEQLLSLLDSSKYEIEIFCALHRGVYKAAFRDYKVLKQNSLLWYLCVNYRDINGITKYVVLALKTAAKALRFTGINIFDMVLRRVANDISHRDYDVVVAFAEGYVTSMVSYVECRKKAAWIHLDYKRLLHYEPNAKQENKDIYSKFEFIVSPSQFSRQSFEDVYPELRDKIQNITNVIDSEKIKALSQEASALDELYDTSQFTIVSVGRICYEKRFFEIPLIAAKIKQSNSAPFKWYIIGDGSEMEVSYVRQEIEKNHVADCVILLGSKNNPYTYISRCNLVVVTSISETFSYVIAEAKVLGVPIVSTDFGSSKEVIDENSGIISPLETLDCQVSKMINDVDYYTHLRARLSDYNHDNNKALACIDNLFRC
ncbi:MAG: glycosyltransferase [Rikenellaceae bacterium]